MPFGLIFEDFSSKPHRYAQILLEDRLAQYHAT